MRHRTEVLPEGEVPSMVHFFSVNTGCTNPGLHRDPVALIAKKISRLMLIDNFTNQELASTVVSLCKQLTGANWAEFLLVDGNLLRLVITNSAAQREYRQKFTTIPLDEQSLAGLAAAEKQPKAISNAQTSSLYASFKYQLSSYNARFLEAEAPQSLACVPFLDPTGQVYAVVQLFDKVDDHGSLSFFTDEDLARVEHIGVLVKGVSAMRNRQSAMAKQIEKLNYFDNEKHHLNTISLRLVRKQSLMDALKHLLESTKVMTYEYLDLMTEVMDSEAALLHMMSKEGVLVPWLAYGISLASSDSEEAKALCTRTSEYVVAGCKDALIVRDYNKEKHFAAFADWEKGFMTSISLPVMEGGELVGVLEFFKSDAEFTFRDEFVGKILVEYVGKIDPSRCYSRLPLSGRKDKEATRSYKKFGQAALQTLRQFSMRPEGFQFDFVGYLKQARSNIRDLMKVESCNLYIRDTLTNSLWTWVSYNCQPLSITITPHTLIGYALLNEVVISEQFPCGTECLDAISETASLEGQAVLVVPVFGEVLKGHVLAVIILTRKALKFNAEEATLVKRLVQSIAMTLEYLFFSKYESMEFATGIEAARSQKPKSTSLGVSYPRPFLKAVSMEDVRFYSKVKEIRDVRVENTPLWGESKAYLIKCLCQVGNLPAPRLQALKEWLLQIDSNVDRALDILQKALPSLIQCQIAKVFVFNETHLFLKELGSPVLSKATGLVKQAIVTRAPIVINSAAWSHPVFSDHVDSLGCQSPVESYMAVPVYNFYDEVIGVFVFINSPMSFSSDDLALAQFLSIIPSKTFADVDDTLKKWNDVVKLGMRQQMLLTWCKQIMSVSAVCQQNISGLKEVVHKLTASSDFSEVMHALLDVMTINMTVEEALVFVHHPEGHYSAFTTSESLVLLQPGEELEMRKEALRTEQPTIVHQGLCGKVNILIVPIRMGPDIIGGIELSNKRDDTLSHYCAFTKEDEVIAQQYASYLGDPISRWLRNEKAESTELHRMIRQAASTVNAYPLMSIIRKASQALLNCDRATIFIREKDHMVVLAQGIEQEIPVGLMIPLGVGIVGYVAKHCQTVTIQDAYSDSRFNPEIDKRTGYHTSNMICVPVFDSNHQVIAALQMINKLHDTFNDDDLTILDMFSDVISSALQIFDRFKSVVVERTRLLHVLNSIGSYIIVITKEGKLEYCNQSFDRLFGVSEDIGRTKHFSYWLRENPEIISDLQAVIDAPNTKIAKQFQPLAPIRHRRSMSIKTTQDSATEDTFSVHYSITSRLDFTSQEFTGLLFLLEDVTQIVKLKKDMDKMRSKLREMKATTAVQAQTGLNTCLNNLQTLRENYQSLSAESAIEAIGKVISILRSGNLERAHVVFDEVGQQLSEGMKTFINTEYLGRDTDCSPHIHFDRPPSDSLPLDLDASTNLAELRSWSLDIWNLGDLFPYVASMLKDCNLLTQFRIQGSTLINFLSEIKRLYDQRDNPFHNFYHGFNVMHSTYHLVTSTKAHTLFKAEDVFAILVSALCHDVDHTGRTNSFEVSKGSNLALLYHDTSVLEQHHAAIAFFTMQQESCNIFKEVPRDMYLGMRKIIISGILATDMSKHFACIAKMNQRFQDVLTSPLGTQDNDKLSLIDLIVHCSDLAHPTKTFDLCLRWSQLVRQEFISQAKEEAALGLPVTQYMKDLENTLSYLKNEISFNMFVVKPLWECVNQGLQPYVDQQMANLMTNIQCYKDKLAEEEKDGG